MAGSPCPIEVLRKVMDKMHVPEMTVAYGMTETSPLSFQVIYIIYIYIYIYVCVCVLQSCYFFIYIYIFIYLYIYMGVYV